MISSVCNTYSTKTEWIWWRAEKNLDQDVKLHGRPENENLWHFRYRASEREELARYVTTVPICASLITTSENQNLNILNQILLTFTKLLGRCKKRASSSRLSMFGRGWATGMQTKTSLLIIVVVFMGNKLQFGCLPQYRCCRSPSLDFTCYVKHIWCSTLCPSLSRMEFCMEFSFTQFPSPSIHI